MYQLGIALAILALSYITTPYLLILFVPLLYINRYEFMVGCADFILITLHILGLVPDPRYKTSHALGVYTELDLIQNFEDVAEQAQLNILMEYRRTLDKMGRNGVLPSGLDEQDDRVTFSREFQQNHNLYSLPTPLASGGGGGGGGGGGNNNSSFGKNASFNDDDFLLAKKQQKITNTALSAAATGITVGVSYAAYAASGIYSYASQKYTSYQQSHQTQQEGEVPIEQQPSKSLPLDNEQQQQQQQNQLPETSTQPPLSTPTQSITKTQPLQQMEEHEEEEEGIQLDSPPARIINPMATPTKSILSSSITPRGIELDNLNTILEEQQDESTDNFVDSLQRSFSSLFSTRKSLTSHYVSTTGNNKSRFSIQSSNNTSNNNTGSSHLMKSTSFSPASHSTATSTTPSPLSSPLQPQSQPGMMMNSSNNDLLLGTSSDQPIDLTITTSQYGPLNTTNQLRARLHRLSNQPQQNYADLDHSNNNNNNNNNNNDTTTISQLSSSSSSINTTSSVASPTTTTGGTTELVQKGKQRISYVEKYKKLDQEREQHRERTVQEKTNTILTHIGQNRNIKKLEQQLYSYLDPSPTASLNDDSITPPITISLTSFITKLMTQSSIYQSLSRPSTSLSMLMSNHYKDSLKSMMESDNGIKGGDKLINIPLLMFRFVDYTTIHLVLMQFAYVFSDPTNQPIVPLTLNNAQGSKEHPTLNVMTTALPQAPLSPQSLTITSAQKQKQQITPLLLLSSTLTTYNIYDLIYILNNYSFDKKFQFEFLSQQNHQINSQLIHSTHLKEEFGSTKLQKATQIHTQIGSQVVQNSYTNSTTSNTEMITVANNIISQSPSIITIPQLYDKSHLVSLTSSSSLTVLSKDHQLAGDNSALLLPLGSLSHVVPGRRRSLYNAPISSSSSSSPASSSLGDMGMSTGSNLDSSSTSTNGAAQGQAAINSLHHSLFFSLVVDTDIYDFICLTSHQRDVIVKDLKDLVGYIVEENQTQGQSTPSSSSSPNSTTTAITKSNPVSEEQAGTTLRGGYNLRSRNRDQNK